MLCSHTAPLQPLTHTCRASPAPTPSSPGSHRLGQARFTWGGHHYPQLLTRGCLPSEEELTLTRENSIRRLHSHHSDPRNQVGAKVGCICGAGGGGGPSADQECSLVADS